MVNTKELKKKSEEKRELKKKCFNKILEFVNNKILSGNIEMNTFEKSKNEDGYLYVKYTGETCFG